MCNELWNWSVHVHDLIELLCEFMQIAWSLFFITMPILFDWSLQLNPVRWILYYSKRIDGFYIRVKCIMCSSLVLFRRGWVHMSLCFLIFVHCVSIFDVWLRVSVCVYSLSARIFMWGYADSLITVFITVPILFDWSLQLNPVRWILLA